MTCQDSKITQTHHRKQESSIVTTSLSFTVLEM